MPPLWWYTWDLSEAESSEDETYNDARGLTGTEIEHLRLDRATLAYIAPYISASALADTIFVDTNLHDQFRSYPRREERMRMRAPRADMPLYVDMHWIYGRSAHDDDTSTHAVRESARAFDRTETRVAVLLDGTTIRQSCCAGKDPQGKMRAFTACRP